jgi:hypothetical protein
MAALRAQRLIRTLFIAPELGNKSLPPDHLIHLDQQQLFAGLLRLPTVEYV